MKGLRDLNYEERLKALKLQCLEIKKVMKRDHKVIYNQIGLEATQLFKFSRRPLRLLPHTGRTRRRRNIFACRVVKSWNRLPLAVASVPEQLAFKRQLDTFTYL